MRQGFITLEGEGFSPDQVLGAFVLDNVMSVVVLREVGKTGSAKMVVEVGHYDNAIDNETLYGLAEQVAKAVGTRQQPRTFRIVEGRGAILSGF